MHLRSSFLQAPKLVLCMQGNCVQTSVRGLTDLVIVLAHYLSTTELSSSRGSSSHQRHPPLAPGPPGPARADILVSWHQQVYTLQI